MNNKIIIKFWIMDSVKEFLYGGIGGMCGVLLSQPFDVTKTRLQNNMKITMKGLYKGTIPPLIGVGFEKAVVFGVYNNTYKYTKNHFLSGGLAGLCASIVVTPFERIKIMLQTNQKIQNVNIKYLFRGLSATFTRETPGFAIYFYVFNKLKDNTKEMNSMKTFLYGGITATISWCFIYPQDRIKTILQATTDNSNFINVFKKIKENEGIKGLYKGFHFALLRAIPLHAGTFLVVETIKNKNK